MAESSVEAACAQVPGYHATPSLPSPPPHHRPPEQEQTGRLRLASRNQGCKRLLPSVGRSPQSGQWPPQAAGPSQQGTNATSGASAQPSKAPMKLIGDVTAIRNATDVTAVGRLRNSEAPATAGAAEAAEAAESSAAPEASAAELAGRGKGAVAAALLQESLEAPGLAAAASALLHSELGNILLQEGEQAEAEEHLKTAVQLNSSATRPGGANAACSEGRQEDEEEDDWETEWEDSLAQLKLDDDQPKEEPGPPPKPAPREPSRPGRPAPSLSKPEATVTPNAAGSTNPGEHGNVIEIYDIKASASISDLEAFVEDFKEPGSSCRPVLVVVDDFHALGVFTTPVQARQALAMALQAGLQARPYAEASPASKRVPDSQLQPPKARPKTTSAVARRLLGSALGMNLRDKAADKELAEQRRAKKQAMQAKKQAQSEAWED